MENTQLAGQKGSPRKRRTRMGWAIAAFVLSAVSLGVELIAHVCAGIMFDPLPDTLSVAAYVFLAGMLLVNEYALLVVGRVTGANPGTAAAPPGLRRLLGASLFYTGAALAAAGAYTVMFLPLLLITLPVHPFFPFIWAMGGICAWSPPLNLWVLVAQWRALRAAAAGCDPAFSRRAVGGAAACGVATVLLLVGRPVAIGYHLQRALEGGPARNGSIAWLQTLGAEPVVLDLCYRNEPWMWVGLGRYLAKDGEVSDPSTAARKLYYRLTGRPFESADARKIVSRSRSWTASEVVVEEQGGELVGRAVHGLSLGSSRLDGVVDPAAETAYCEWTLTFKNSTTAAQEARAEIVLPEGGVVDKVSLWINGEERPAAFGPRSVVRQAYEEVAVAQRRDPLLVTARESGRVMAQCFPVPPRGTMKIRLGMSAPLVWKDASAPRLCFTPPAFQQVNFRLPDDLRHALWLEGHWSPPRGRLGGSAWVVSDGPAPAGQPAAERTHTARLDLPAAGILDPPTLTIAGGLPPRVGDRLSPGLVRRESPFRRHTAPVDLLFVLDTGAGMEGAVTTAGLKALAAALATLPVGSQVRFVDVQGPTHGKDEGWATPWVPAAEVRRVEGWWSARRYRGGVEPGEALARAWAMASARPHPSAVIWLHGATPPAVGDAAALAQNLDRRPRGPVLVGVRLRPGPDTLMDELAGYGRVYTLAAREGTDTLGDAVRLAAAALQPASPAPGTPLGGRVPALNGVFVAPAVAVPAIGARTIPAERLAFCSQVLAPWYDGARQGSRLEKARKLAIARRLVTPMSGAVVLETGDQYARHGLSDAVVQGSIPSVPEPGVLALLAVVAGMAMVAVLRRRLERRRLWVGRH